MKTLRARLSLVPIIAVLALLLLTGPLALADEELIKNGGFEGAPAQGLPEDWYYEAWFQENDIQGGASCETLDGSGAVYVYCGGDGNDARLCQSVDVEGDTYYKLTCKIRADGVEGGAGANISVVGSLAASEGVFGTTDGWITAELVGKTAKGQKEIIVCVRVGGYGALSVGGAWFDDVSVTRLASFSGDAADFSTAQTGGGDDDEGAVEAVPGIGYMVAALLASALACIIVYRKYIETDNSNKICDGANDGIKLAVILACAFIVRCIASLLIFGHSTDINCFMAWANTLANNGMSTFYTSGMFADYPPGYMYALWAVGKLAKLFDLAYGSAGYALVIKLPGIVADMLAAYALYRLARKRNGDAAFTDERTGALPLVLAGVVAFNPLMAFISGGWGQIDQLLSLLLLAVILLFVDGKVVLAGLVYGIAIMTKPQALIVGPLFAVAYFCYIKDTDFVKGLLKTVAAVLCALAAIFIMSLPFAGGQQPLWFIDKLLGTATSYPYASVEAFNLMALLGGNWKNVNETVLGISYGALGTALIAASVVFAGVMYAIGRKREKHCLTLSAAWLITAVFTLGQYMHERYVFPALTLLLVAFIFYRDRRIFTSFCLLLCSALLNAMLAFVIVDNQSCRGVVYDIFTYAGSVLTILSFAYLTYTCCDMVFRKVKHPAFAAKKLEKPAAPPLPEKVKVKTGFVKKDRLYVSVLTLVYAVIALVNLGTTTAPENYWTGAEGDTVTITLPARTKLGDIRVYGGLYTGTVELTGGDGSSLTYVEDNGDMFRWKSIGGEGWDTDTITLHVSSGEVWFNELAVFDESGEMITLGVSGGGEALVDEPEKVPSHGSYMYGMYFDELYHARTAYEHLNGIKPYENSHPPLGKVFIMLGIAVFGMNAFGWRVVGALFGIAMVPILYAFARRLFKNSEYALLAAFLFAFDFMHYTQTRIATIDVYGVFFIILMFYFMYRYYELNFYTDGLLKTLKPLALGGVFFGLGAASKWICIYAGGGMAVLLFTSLAMRFREYLKLRNSELEAERNAVKPFLKNTVLTLVWCCMFYIAVPVAIYALSYIPYVLSEAHYDLKGIWGVQEFMLNYHSGLKATHPYMSPWWQWPLMIRPMWYHVNYDVAEGSIGTISAMGNPAVWWVCCVGSAAALIQLIRGKLKPDKKWFVLFVALLAELLPWVLVTRCTFIYHYFACVPFIILISVYLLQKKEELDPRYGKVKWIWMGVALALFIIFYPVITGVPVAKWYVKLLEWLPSWTFMGY